MLKAISVKKQYFLFIHLFSTEIGQNFHFIISKAIEFHFSCCKVLESEDSDKVMLKEKNIRPVSAVYADESCSKKRFKNLSLSARRV